MFGLLFHLLFSGICHRAVAMCGSIGVANKCTAFRWMTADTVVSEYKVVKHKKFEYGGMVVIRLKLLCDCHVHRYR